MARLGGLGMRVYIRKPKAEDAEEFVSITKGSIESHRPWVYPATTVNGFFDYLNRCDGERNVGYFVCRKKDDAIVGVVNVNEIVGGSLQGAFVGYWLANAYQGNGYMTEGLALVFDAAFSELKLHRLEVNIQPANTRSLALAERLGLNREGFSPKYLYIDGAWRDHERWAVLVEDWIEAGGAIGVLGNLRR